MHLHLHHLVWSSISHLVIVAIRLSGRLLLCKERFKIGVVEGSLGRYTPSRVVHEHLLEQVEAVVIEVSAKGVVVVALPLGEGWFKVGVRCDTRPSLLRRCTENTG